MNHCRLNLLRRSIRHSLTMQQKLHSSKNLSANGLSQNKKDDAIPYSSSKASSHTVNDSFGTEKRGRSIVPSLVFGITMFTGLIYLCFFREGDRDIFSTDIMDKLERSHRQITDSAAVERNHESIAEANK